MTSEGRLARGKENFLNNVFLDNPETIAYAATLQAEKPKPEPKPKEKKNASK